MKHHRLWCAICFALLAGCDTTPNVRIVDIEKAVAMCDNNGGAVDLVVDARWSSPHHRIMEVRCANGARFHDDSWEVDDDD